MKKQMRRRIISILLILLMLVNMFSPYSILLNESYAADELDKSEDYIFMRRETDIQIETDSDGNEVKYFYVLLGVTGDYYPEVVDIEMKYDTSKIALVNKTFDELTADEGEQASGIKVKRYMEEVMPDIYTTQYGSETLTSIDPAEGRITVNASMSEAYNPADPDIIELLESDYELPVPDGYNGWIPIYRIRFKLISTDNDSNGFIDGDYNNDGVLDENDITTNLVKFKENDRSATGISIAGTDVEGNDILLESLDYVKYDGFVIVEEVKKELSSIEINTNPTKTIYIKGESLNLDGGKITLIYDDATTEELSMTGTGVTVEGYDKTKLGEQTITVTYEGMTTTFKVNVTNEVTEIEIKSNPTKTIYIKGEELDLTDGEIIAKHENTTTENILMTAEGVTVEGYDKTIVGEQTITVTYEGKTITFKVKVINPVAEISVKTTPKTEYEKGEELDLTGGEITITYEDTTTEDILMTAEGVAVEGYDKTKVGEQTLTVTYVEKTTTFDVEVTNEVIGIAIKTEPTKTEYVKDEALKLTGGKITVTYKDNTTEDILMTAEGVTVTGYDKTIVGEQTLTVTYEGMTTTFKVNVTEVVIVLGDINLDGEINARDAKLAIQHFTGKTELTIDQQGRADVNKDGNINARDAKLIIQFFTGKITEF